MGEVHGSRAPALVGSGPHRVAERRGAVQLSEGTGATQTGEKIDNLVSAHGPAGPIAVVKSSLSRALSTAQSPPAGPDRGNDRGAEMPRPRMFDFKEMAGGLWVNTGRPCLRRSGTSSSTCSRTYSIGPSGRSSKSTPASGWPSWRTRSPKATLRVHSRVIPNEGPEISIEYRLFDGSRWAVYDVVFDGRSLVSNYRSQFDSLTGECFRLSASRVDAGRTVNARLELLTPPFANGGRLASCSVRHCTDDGADQDGRLGKHPQIRRNSAFQLELRRRVDEHFRATGPSSATAGRCT